MRHARPARHAPAWLAIAALIASALLLAACGSGGAARHATLAQVSERDFKITSTVKDVPAGAVDLAVHNRGPEAHELIVVRDIGGAPPLRADGLTVNEEALQKYEAGSLEPGQPGGVRHLHMTLAPGRYELLCNMAGHYLGGMHTELVVR